MWPGPYGEWGSRKYLLAILDQSLTRMGLDYVDIFYSHRSDPDTPLEETMGRSTPRCAQGKALYAGISSYSAERTAEAAAILRDLGTPLLIHQPSYSLLNRWIEDGPARRPRRARASAASSSRRSPRGCSPTSTSTASPRARARRAGPPSSPDLLSEETLDHVRALNAIARGAGRRWRRWRSPGRCATRA